MLMAPPLVRADAPPKKLGGGNLASSSTCADECVTATRLAAIIDRFCCVCCIAPGGGGSTKAGAVDPRLPTLGVTTTSDALQIRMGLRTGTTAACWEAVAVLRSQFDVRPILSRHLRDRCSIMRPNGRLRLGILCDRRSQIISWSPPSTTDNVGQV